MLTRKILTRFLCAIVLFASFITSNLAQEFRGSITGRVTEASGAAVPNATVTITNVATNTAASVTSDDAGGYSLLYLTPGSYRVTVEAKGFKKAVRENVEVRISDKLELGFTLEVGAVTDSVNITADAPLLEASSASAGQVVDQRRISELPLSDGNPFVLSRLAPGIAYNGDLKFSRPFDNGGTSGIVANGAPGRNEFTLDGVPNMASGGGLGRVAFVPPSDAVQEFKVETANYDGQQAHTAGATVNVTLKSGTNKFHGTVYEYVRNDVLSANDYFINRTNLTALPSRDRNKDGKADRDPLRYNRYGATVGGPVYLPRFGTGGKPYWSGQNRSFFFFSYERLKDVFPEPGLFTVPTEAERNGDFSALLPSIVIYDPATARAAANGRVQRDAFPGNKIPANRLNAIAKNFLQFFPQPNQPGDSQGRFNYFSPQPRFDTFHTESVRFDQTISDKQRFFVRYTHNNRRESRSNWTGEVNGIRPTGNYLFRINNGGSFDHLYSLSPNTVLNTRIGYTRFNEPNIRQHQGAISAAQLGFPAATVALFGPEPHLPPLAITPFDQLGSNVGDGSNYNIYSVQPTLTKLAGKHSFKAGYDFRSYRENAYNPGFTAGVYIFTNAYTTGPFDNSAGAPIGQELASMLLGRPQVIQIDRNTARSNQTLYHGMFFHDDWKISNKLTLNLGVRYEYEGATTERYNRNLYNFDTTVASPIEAAAKTAYATAPIAEVPASGFSVKGGVIFADKDHRSFWDADKNNYQPRIGLAYKLNDKTVLRGGWGLYSVPFTINGVNQTGFSVSTTSVGSLDNGLSFVSTLDNPFPFGVLSPSGASLGLTAQLGSNVTFLPRDLNNAQAQRWSFGVQRELPGNWLVELQYVGNHGYDLVVNTNILNAIPKKYLSTSNFRDQSQIDANNFLNTVVTNPFRNLIPGSSLNGGTTSRSQLLRAFPEFTTITTSRNDGYSDFHSLQARIERRFSKGYTFLASYTFSKFLEAISFLNEQDTAYERRLNDTDLPHRLVVSGIWELPFGRGRSFCAKWNRAIDAVLGGWQLQGIGQFQSGRPLTMGNVYYNGDITKLTTDVSSKNIDGTVFNTSGFYFTDAAVQTNGVVDPAKQRSDPRIALIANYRTLPSRYSRFRGDNLNLWDLSVSKNFTFTESVKFHHAASS
ncbi:MAG: carboxypeptidase-like regulatory domain-containing protein [Blastocatellia bacterium]